jgi:AP-1 complex subunit gamma-1
LRVVLSPTRINPNRYTLIIPTSQSLGYSQSSAQANDQDIVDLLISILDSPYANYLTRQFVLAAVTKISSRSTTSTLQQDRIAVVLANYTTSPELELQQRAVEFASLFSLGNLREGVLERMPPPELKATVMGVGESLLASEVIRVVC